MDIKTTLHLAHRTIVLQHTDTERITARRQRHIGNVGIGSCGLDPFVVEALQLVHETGSIVDAAIIGGHVDGELVLFILQTDATLHVKRLLENHTAVVFFSDLNLLVEEY